MGAEQRKTAIKENMTIRGSVMGERNPSENVFPEEMAKGRGRGESLQG